MGRRLTALGILALAIAAAPALANHANADEPSRGAPAVAVPIAERDSAVCRNFAAAAASDATCTVLYAHLFELLDGVPLTTQPPTDACPDLAKGVTTVPAAPPLLDTAHMDLWSMAGPIEYAAAKPGADGTCDPRLHPQRGLAGDVRLDARVPLTVHWFLSADSDDVSLLADPSGPDTGAMPCVEVRVTLQTGRHFGQGVVLAQGSARRTILSSGAAEPQRLPQLDPCAQGDLVLAHHPFLELARAHEFPISLGPVAMPLPAKEGFVVHVEWSQVRDGPVEANQREWNVHGGPDFRNRLVLPVLAPLRMEAPRVTPHGQHFLVLDASVASPWGTYDVDAASIRLDIIDENGHAVAPQSIAGPKLRTGAAAHALFEPVNATWAWDFLKAQASPGPYEARVTASNAQHTGTLVQTTTVDVPALLVRPSPGPALPLLAAAVVAAVLLAARRH